MRITIEDSLYYKLQIEAAERKMNLRALLDERLNGEVAKSNNGRKPKKGVMPEFPVWCKACGAKLSSEVNVKNHWMKEPEHYPEVLTEEPSGERVGETEAASQEPNQIPPEGEQFVAKSLPLKWTAVPIWKDPINRGNPCPDCKAEEGNKHRPVCNYVKRERQPNAKEH